MSAMATNQCPNIDFQSHGSMKWYCFHCGWNCKPEFWDNNLTKAMPELGQCWLCHNCGLHGKMCDPDAPKEADPESYLPGESEYDFANRLFGNEE